MLRGEVRLAVIARDMSRAAPDDHPVTAFVEHLRDARLQSVIADGAVEGDTDVAAGEVGGAPEQPPRHASGLVIQGRVEIPPLGGFILEGASSGVRRPECGVPGGATG